MTVCITGDVHHMSLDTRDQEYLDRTELEVALEYASVADRYDVPVTLFCTGKCGAEEPERVRRLTAMDHVEVGGHNYYAFDTPVHKVWRAVEKVTNGLVGSWNGPRLFQTWEIMKTVTTLEAVGAEVQSWRDHAYRHDERTPWLLSDQGITHFSDAVGPRQQVRREAGLCIVPVNTPPDHEHVYHAFRTPEFVADSGFEGPFGRESVTIDAWVDWTLDTAEDLLTDSGVATVLAHPACMDLADDLDGFERLCREVSDHELVQVSEIVT